MTTSDKRHAAAIAFMKNLQALDITDLDRGLRAMSVEAANLFPMISDRNETDAAGGNKGAAYRDQLLRESIFRVTDDGKQPSLTLENNILITSDGKIVDGRNRVAAVLRNANELPLIDWDELAKDPDQISAKVHEILTAKQTSKDAADILMGKATAAWNDADLLFKHVTVTFDAANLQFDQIMKLNMARRDLNTSQRACVAANVSAAAFKRFGGPSKPTDANIADSFGIGHKTMKRAKAVKKANSALFNEVLEGKMSIGKAEAMVKAMAAADEAEDAPEAAETKTKAPKVEKAVVYGAEAITAGIANSDVAGPDLFNAILNGLERRFGTDSTEFSTIEGALAALCGVDLQ